VMSVTNAHVPMRFLCRKNAIVAANVSNAPGTTISVTCKQARRQGVSTSLNTQTMRASDKTRATQHNPVFAEKHSQTKAIQRLAHHKEHLSAVSLANLVAIV